MNSTPDGIDRSVARAKFLRQARTGGARDPLSAEVAARSLETLEAVRMPAGPVLDLGAGVSAPPLPGADRWTVSLDWVAWPPAERAFVVAAAESLPFAAGSFGVVWSNLVLPWIDAPETLMTEARRVLADGGLFVGTALGPDTLRELNWPEDGPPRTHAFFDMHDLADMLGQNGFAEPVAQRETLSFTYRDHRGKLQDLRKFGILAASGMSTHLGQKAAIDRLLNDPGPPQLTFEIIYLHAWAMPARAPKGAAGWTEMQFVPAAGGKEDEN